LSAGYIISRHSCCAAASASAVATLFV
jgi:hypothetical protein